MGSVSPHAALRVLFLAAVTEQAMFSAVTVWPQTPVDPKGYLAASVLAKSPRQNAPTICVHLRQSAATTFLIRGAAPAVV